MELQCNPEIILKSSHTMLRLSTLLDDSGSIFSFFFHLHFFQTSRAERTRYLIDTLIQNGTNHSFEVFVDTLQKDHRWLWEKFTIDNMKNPDFNDSFEDSLSRGDVPRLPDHYVPRMKVVSTERLLPLVNR